MLFANTTCQIDIAEQIGNRLWILEFFVVLKKYFTKVRCSDVFFTSFCYEQI